MIYDFNVQRNPVVCRKGSRLQLLIAGCENLKQIKIKSNSAIIISRRCKSRRNKSLKSLFFLERSAWPRCNLMMNFKWNEKSLERFHLLNLTTVWHFCIAIYISCYAKYVKNLSRSFNWIPVALNSLLLSILVLVFFCGDNNTSANRIINFT